MGFKNFEGIEASFIKFFVDNLPASFNHINTFYNDGLIITPPTDKDIQLSLISAPANTENPVLTGIFDTLTGADSGRGKLATNFKFRWIHLLPIGNNNDTQAKRKILFRQLSAILLTIDNCLQTSGFDGVSNSGISVTSLTPTQAVDDTGKPINALASGIILEGVIK